MKKIVLAALVVLLLTIGLSVYFLLSNLDSIVKTAIETYGSEATQTSVHVSSVKIVLQDGSGAIQGLTVNNPKGFAEPKAFSLGTIATQIDLKSLSEEIPVIEHITIRAPEVFFELNQEGKNNLASLMQNLKGSSSSSSGKEASGAEPKLIIRKLLFSGGNIHARVVPLNKDYELKLPDIKMNNIGGNTGATPTQIADQVLKVLTDRALTAIKKEGIDQYKAQLEGEINKRLGEEKEKIETEVQDKLKGVLNFK